MYDCLSNYFVEEDVCYAVKLAIIIIIVVVVIIVDDEVRIVQ